MKPSAILFDCTTANLNARTLSRAIETYVRETDIIVREIKTHVENAHVTIQGIEAYAQSTDLTVQDLRVDAADLKAWRQNQNAIRNSMTTLHFGLWVFVLANTWC